MTVGSTGDENSDNMSSFNNSLCSETWESILTVGSHQTFVLKITRIIFLLVKKKSYHMEYSKPFGWCFSNLGWGDLGMFRFWHVRRHEDMLQTIKQCIRKYTNIPASEATATRTSPQEGTLPHHPTSLLYWAMCIWLLTAAVTNPHRFSDWKHCQADHLTVLEFCPGCHGARAKAQVELYTSKGPLVENSLSLPF